MADWVVISSLATAGGTLVLAATTYASVRSANRAARTAEQSMLAGLRPLLFPSRGDDPAQRAGFADGVGVTIRGGEAGVEVLDGRIYIGLSLRNVGTGIAVLHGGYVYSEVRTASVERAPLDDFRLLSRDLYIPPGDIGFWQVAFRDESEPQTAELRAAVEGGSFSVDVLYGDYEGGQRVVSRYGVRKEGEAWQLTAVRHWQIDRASPR